MFGIAVSTFFLLYAFVDLAFYDLLNPEQSLRIESQKDQYAMLIDQAKSTEEKEQYKQQLEQSLKHDYTSSIHQGTSMRTIARSLIFLALCLLLFFFHWRIIKSSKYDE